MQLKKNTFLFFILLFYFNTLLKSAIRIFKTMAQDAMDYETSVHVVETSRIIQEQLIQDQIAALSNNHVLTMLLVLFGFFMSIYRMPKLHDLRGFIFVTLLFVNTLKYSYIMILTASQYYEVNENETWVLTEMENITLRSTSFMTTLFMWIFMWIMLGSAVIYFIRRSQLWHFYFFEQNHYDIIDIGRYETYMHSQNRNVVLFLSCGTMILFFLMQIDQVFVDIMTNCIFQTIRTGQEYAYMSIIQIFMSDIVFRVMLFIILITELRILHYFVN